MGAVGIGVGSVTGLISLSRASDAESVCDGKTCPPEAQDDIDASKSMGTVSYIAFGVSLAGAAVGVWSLLSAGSADDTPGDTAWGSIHFGSKRRSIAVAPMLGPGSVGLAGRF